MKRRRWLRTFGAGLTSGLVLPLLPPWLSGCKPEEPGPEINYNGIVGIVGAGASGLYVADMLHSKGIAVRIFEASDRVGGRIRSIRHFEDSPVETDFPIELGADRIFGSDSLWADMIGKLQIPTVEVLPAGKECYILDGVFGSGADFQQDADFDAAQKFVAAIGNYSGPNVSVAQAIANAGISQRVNDILNAEIANKFGTSNDRLGIVGLREILTNREHDEAELTLRSNPMHDVVASRFSSVVPFVELNTVVNEIDYSGPRVAISASGSDGNVSIEVDKLIVTVPVSILKQNTIKFTPAFPKAKNDSMSLIGMDAAVRVVLDFKQNFWAGDCSYIYGLSGGSGLFASGIGRSEYNKTLSLTAFGAAAEELSTAGPEAIGSILDQLDGAFDGKATSNIRRNPDGAVIYEWKDWGESPFIRGGVSYLKPGGAISDREELGRRLSDKMFFAGEATDVSGNAGTINGALASAERCADEVIASIVGSTG